MNKQFDSIRVAFQAQSAMAADNQVELTSQTEPQGLYLLERVCDDKSGWVYFSRLFRMTNLWDSGVRLRKQLRF